MLLISKLLNLNSHLSEAPKKHVVCYYLRVVIKMNEIQMNVSVSVVNFWNAMEIYYKHPNSINKQVLFQEHIFSVNLPFSINQSECQRLYEKFYKQLLRGNCPYTDYFINKPNFAFIEPEYINEVFKNETGMYLLVRRLVPKLCKNDNIKFYEFIFLDKNYMKVYIFTGHAVSSDSINPTNITGQDPFVILKFDFIQLNWSTNNVNLFYNKSLNEKGINWIKVAFVKKFKKLLCNESSCEKPKNFNKSELENQVDLTEYYKLYEKLKQKYAKTLIENWTEATDPKKFVYEDIGIAAYLMLIWKKESMKKQKFVDLGCGNGLLVYILTSEGHEGIGLDIKKRKIWNTYPSTTVLKEETIVPTTGTKYPEADWLIGNHSDELTSWLPILARRSNHLCQYFVLPCCPYQLNGKKFQRKNSSLSSYQDFIHYVKNISDLCQFKTVIDKLRIPSTKRICILGFNYNNMTEEQHALINSRIVDLIAKECINIDNTKNKFTFDFTPREPTEPVRNCTKVPNCVKENILKTVMNKLLEENILVSVTKDKKIHFWNKGGKISINSLAACIDEDLLKQLKKECRGLQTLLKNHHFLFEVKKGTVQFRTPESMLNICKKIIDSPNESKWKRKKCWLFSNHPNGCPLSDDTCSYAHDK